MEEKKLYPLRFCSLRDDYDWGCETFLLADLGYRDTFVRDGWLAGNGMGEIMDTYMERVVGDNVYEYYGRQFPVCVRKIHVEGRMPLRVHPDDETAGQRYDFLGKEKLWYVQRCGRNANVMLGFREDTDASAVYSKCGDNSIDELLNCVAPHAGQYFHIPPGTPHCAEGDIDILEISQSSPVDICMCAWGKTVSAEEFDDALTLVDAMDFIGYKAFKSEKSGDSLLDIPQFRVEKIELKSALHSYCEQAGSFVLYVCAGGSASAQVEVLGQTASFPFKDGEALLVPAECNDFRIVPTDSSTTLLEVEVPHIVERDSYINRDVPATLDD